MKNTGFNRAISFVLGLVILIQLFCAVPVSAETALCYIKYNDESVNEPENGKIYPNVEEPLDAIDPFDVTVGEPIPEDLWPSDPTRIIGKRFLGWFVKDTNTQIMPGTVLTSDMFIMGGTAIYIEGRWAVDDCADIETAVLRSYDHLGNMLSSGVQLYNKDGVAVDFDRDITEYTVKVLNNAVFAEFDFHIYEPYATYEITYNDEEPETDWEYTTTWSNAEEQEFNSGIDVKMERVTLLEKSDRETNDIVVKVTAKNGDEKIYSFNIERSAEEVKLAYGNTPFGRIAGFAGTTWTDERRQQAREEFASTQEFYGASYKQIAWGDDVETEVVGGAVSADGEFRNYDKDETAVVAYIGSSFTDPGFTVYNADGEAVSLDSTHTVRRTIGYDAVSSYDFADFDDVTSTSVEAILTGAENENIISLLKDEKVRPGVYTIRYDYLADGNETGVYAERKLIAIPRPGDLNMDGYINSVDVAMFNRADKPTVDSRSGRLYLYRGMDIDRDGDIDADDTAALRDRTTSGVSDAYPDLTAAETVEQAEYTSPGNTEIAQMYMEYLGKNNDDIINSAANLPTEAQQNEALDKGDIFWIGYRIDNTAAVEALQKGVYSLTVAINYDSRYISPAVVLTADELAQLDESEQWLATLKKYNDVWSGYTYNGFTNSALAYTANNTTAKSTLQSAKRAKSLVMDITAGENLHTLENGDYILRVPFVVNIVPPEGAAVTDAALDANLFNITTGDGGETTLQWDTKGTLSNNLADVIDFKGTYSPEFVEEEPAISLNEYFNKVYTYGDNSIGWQSMSRLLASGTVTESPDSEDLPEGVSYVPNTKLLKGTPKEAGYFVFYINGIKLSLTISKAPMTVTAENKTKMYGEDNPELTFTYNTADLTSVDTNGLDSEGFLSGLVAPQLSCDADAMTEFGEEVDIVISGGESDNYYFVYENGVLEVNEQRPITVNEVSIPVCTSEIAYVNRNNFPYAIATSSSTDDNTLKADGIINGDVVKVNYDVVYPNNSVADSVGVTVENMTVDENGRSGNYKIGTNKMTTGTGKVLDRVITKITVIQAPPNSYQYGDKYSYHRDVTNIVLNFDNTQVINRLSVGDMAQYGVSVKAYDANGNEMTDVVISDSLNLDAGIHNGMVVTLVPPENSGLEPVKLQPIVMTKRDLRVAADNKTRVYGDPNPEFTFTFNDEDFAYAADKTDPELRGENAPTIYSNALQTSDVNEYTIFLRGGTHDNYRFITTDGKLTVTHRPLDIVSINRGIPELTAKMIAEDPDAAEYVIASTATRSQLTVNNAYGNDDFKITYDAVYTDKTSNSVEIRNVVLITDDAGYPKAKNYTLRNKPTQATGAVLEKAVESFEIVTQPYLEYTYGDALNLNSGLVHIKYDNGDEFDVTFDKLAEHNISLRYAYTTGKITSPEVKGSDLVNVPDYNGNYMILESNSAYKPQALSTDPFTVHKATANIAAVATSSVYGDTPQFDYEYNTDDFKGDDKLNPDSVLSQLPKISCTATNKSEVGQYEVTLSGAEADNYEFTYTSGMHTVTQKSITIRSITGNVPALTSEFVYNNPGSEYRVPAEAVYNPGDAENEPVNQMTVETLVDGDAIRITYKAVYMTSNAAESYVVMVEEVELDENYGKGKNYQLADVPNMAAGGKIYARKIQAVEIAEQPELAYIYGRKLDLSKGRATIIYDSGQMETVGFAQLANYSVKLTYTGTDVTPTSNDLLAVADSGITMTLTPDPSVSLADVQSVTTEEINISRKRVNITATGNDEYTYGETPEVGFAYAMQDFVAGESPYIEGSIDGFVPPEVKALTGGGIEVDNQTEVSDRNCIIRVSGGQADNYEFEYTDKEFKIVQREINITAITGAPALSSYNVAHGIFELDAHAYVADMTIQNLVNNDNIKILYTARYETTTPGQNISVTVLNPTLEDGYGKNKNYKLGSVAATASGGEIYARKIQELEITEQPDLEYTYGEKVDLSVGKLKITYDSDEYEIAPFNQLAEYNIALTYSGTATTPTGDDMLTVADSGTTMTLTPNAAVTLAGVESVTTEGITIIPKQVNVIANNTTSIYGDTPQLGFTYKTEDFVTGENPEIEGTVDGLVAPVVRVVTGDDTEVDSTTEVGDNYITIASGGSAANYEFVYTNGIHTITPREIEVTAITGGVPSLPSDKVAQGVFELDAWADMTLMTVENRVNNDDIKILYTAKYETTVPGQDIDVTVLNAKLEEGYGKNRNYTLKTVVDKAPGGRVYAREITKIEIIEQPKLDYTYGDTLDLSGGRVKITYDSTESQSISFGQLVSANYKIGLTYTGTADVPTNGEVLTVPYHNGATITLTAETTHENVESPSTAAINVEKKVLGYGDCIVDTIVYDGSTTLTTGTVVLTGAENGDTVGATGVFNFENCLAGEEKTVYVTEIVLDAQTDLNYQLAADNTTATGAIEKATPVAQLAEENIVLSEENIITINAPEMTQVQLEGGAEYEYSIDGGQTWQQSNIFENLELRQDCDICIRFAETSNFKQSEATTPITLKTYLNRLTLISVEDMKTLKSLFTNVELVRSSYDLDELIGDVDVTYYGHYSDKAGKVKIVFPMTLMGDEIIYTSLDKNSGSGGGAGALYKQKSGGSSPVIDIPEPPVVSEPDDTDAYKPYINGYQGKVSPDDYMTRAEAVTIMINIIGDTGLEYENVFPDVSDDAWYADLVAQATARGLITGFSDGLFHPEEIVTREQFATMVARMRGLEPLEGVYFSDVQPDRWSAGYINAASEAGIVNGYGDGTFRPENPITRAEAISMMNKATGRIPDKSVIDGLECPFSDLPKTHWAYYEIMMAACEL